MAEFTSIVITIVGATFLEICIAFGSSPFRIVIIGVRILSIVTPGVTFVLIKAFISNSNSYNLHHSKFNYLIFNRFN